MSIIAWLLSAVWQGFLGLFGKSDAQKLGREEVTNADLKAALTLSEAQRKAVADAPDEETALKEGKF